MVRVLLSNAVRFASTAPRILFRGGVNPDKPARRKSTLSPRIGFLRSQFIVTATWVQKPFAQPGVPFQGHQTH
jgi:hypothetical protein